KHGRFYNATERAYDWVLDIYKRTLDWAMLHRGLTMVFSSLSLVGTGVLLELVPKGFIPTQDTGSINITTEAAQGTSFDDMVKRQRHVADIVQADPNVEALMSTAGGSGGGNSAANTGRLQVTLKPRDERVDVNEVVAEMRRKLARLAGLTAYPQIPPAIQIGGRTSKSQYQFTSRGSDVATLYPAAAKLIDAARRSPKLQDVTSDLQLNNPQVSVKIDRTRAATFGVSVDAIETTLSDAYGSRQVSTIYTPSNEYFVILELLPQYQQDISALSLLFVKSSSGRPVPLSSLATLSTSSGPVAVNHSGQLPSVTLSFNLADGVSLGEGTAEVQRLPTQNPPRGLTTGVLGTGQGFHVRQ